jgi:ATP-dependent Clp protease adapter protein ClpS
MPLRQTEHSNPKLQPSLFTETEVETPWTLTLYDDDIHTIEEVIHQLIKALGCDQNTAEEITITVHNTGSAIVYEGLFEECFRINSVLAEIQLITEIRG